MTLQMDLFWVYGIGAGFAATAATQLRDTDKKWWETKYFGGMLLYLSVFFVPTAAYLLWGFPAWESMHVFNSRGEIPPIVALLQPLSVMGLGTLGFWVTYRLIAAGRMLATQYNWLLGWFGLFFLMLYGWDGQGWQRFLYDPSVMGGSWSPGEYSLVEWVTGDVLLTLLVMGVFVIPPLVYLNHRYLKEGEQLEESIFDDSGRRGLLGNTYQFVMVLFVLSIGGAIVAFLVAYGVKMAVGLPLLGAVVGPAVTIAGGYVLVTSDSRPLERLFGVMRIGPGRSD